VKTTQEEEEISAAKEDVGIIPLGIPTSVVALDILARAS